MQTRSKAPRETLPQEGVSPLLRAYYEFNQLKLLYRQGWLKRGIPPEQCESVAEHTLGVAVLALWLLDQHYPHLDRDKVLRMALLHDFGEIYAGDITPADGVLAQEKQSLEAAAVRSIFADLPAGADYVACWEEYEAGETPEARLVRQVDRLEMAFQAGIYRREGLATPEEFFQSARAAVDEPVLLELLAETIALER